MKLHLPPMGCALLAAAAVLVTPSAAFAQSTWVGASNGVWNTTSNWSAAVPNFQDSEADFTNAASVNVTALTNTVGTIVLDAANSNAVTISNGTIDLSVSFGVPTVNIANSAATLFMYANVTGAQGLRKDGPGKFTFRFNPNNQTYSGGISINGGTFGINQAGSLGDSNNDITLESSSVFRFEPGGDSGSIVLGAGNDFILNGSGNTLTVQNSGTNTVNSTINGIISGDGNLAFNGSGTLTVAGSNSYTGTTAISGGTLALGAGAIIPTNTVTMSGTNTGFNLGSNTQSLNTLSLQTDTNQARVFSITNGTLNLGAGAGNFAFNGAQGSTANFAGLSAFTYTAPTRTFFVQPSANNGSNNTNFMLLAATGDGSNNITAAGMTIGGAGSSAGAANGSQLTLGKVNVLNVTNLNIGGFNASGVVDVPIGVTNATLKIRSTDGTSPAGTIKIGETSSGVRPGSGTLTVGTGSVDIVATNLQLGRHLAGANNAETSALTFGGGSLVVTNFTLAEKTGTGTPTITATVNQAGGTVEAATLTMGVGTTSNALPRLLPVYNLAGGTLKAGTITPGFGIAGTNFATNTARRINWTGGSIRPLNSNTNLLITGIAGTGGSIEIPTIGPATKTFTADGSNGITLSSTTWLIANGGDVFVDPGAGGFFTNTGAITIGSGNFPSTNAVFTNAANASVTIASGTATLATDARIFGIGDRTNAGVTNAFNLSGANVTLGLTVNRMLVGNKTRGELNVTGGSLVITGNQPIYVGGDISFGASDAVGVWTVSGTSSVNVGGAGALVLGQNSATTSNITSNSIGVLNLNGGTFTTARAITTGLNTNGTLSTGTVNFNGGAFAAGASVANILNVTTATVSSNGLTYNTGTFDSGMTQNLAGSGTLTVTGTGTLRLNGTNTPPVVVTNGATLGGIGSAGTVTANGTFAPGAPATNGTFTVTSALSVPGTAQFRVFGNGINDKTIASGGATLNGTVAVVVNTNYTPANGDAYDFVDGAISGSPALSLPALGGGLSWVTNAFLSSGVLTVTNGGGPTNNYANWLTNYPSLTGTNALPTANPDGDPYSNSTEFAFDGNPTIGSPAFLTAVKVGTNSVFNYVARKNPPGGVAYQVQFTGNLTNSWTNSGVTVSNSANQLGLNIPADYERKEFTVPATGKEFYRVEATVAP
jgi:fibronectin-binding autotransporter adhesin